MDAILLNGDGTSVTLEDYIEYIHLRLKNPNTQSIPLTDGIFIELWKKCGFMIKYGNMGV